MYAFLPYFPLGHAPLILGFALLWAPNQRFVSQETYGSLKIGMRLADALQIVGVPRGNYGPQRPVEGFGPRKGPFWSVDKEEGIDFMDLPFGCRENRKVSRVLSWK